jgi:hypothetical protein
MAEDMETWRGHENMDGDVEILTSTWKHGNMETWTLRHGNMEKWTWRHGDL